MDTDATTPGSPAIAGEPGQPDPIPPSRTPARLLIRSGYVITMDPDLGDLPSADILVDGSRIVKVAPHIDPGPTWDGEVINAAGKLVTPGLVDNHRHMWQGLIRGRSANLTFGEYFEHTLENISGRFTPEDIYLGNLLSAYEALDAGTTTILDWSHALNTPEHAAAAVQALEDSGIRAVFAYGPPSTQWWRSDGLPRPDDVIELHARPWANPLLGMALAIRGPEFSTMDRVTADLDLARSLGIPVTMHAGIPGFYHMAPSVRLLDQAGLLGPDLTFVHCNAMGIDDFSTIAAYGCHVSCSPEVEIMKGFGFSPVAAIIAGKAHPTVSVDVITAIGGDLLTQLRFLLQTQRATSHQSAIRETGQPLRSLSLSTRDVLPYVTTYAAASLGLDHIGSIAVGNQADLCLFNMHDVNLFLSEPSAGLVQSAHPGNVHTVILAGRVVKRHKRLVGVDLSDLRDQARHANQRLLRDHS
jgi:cytosine/adenosine deaminase-related metal-dependent hydrolase